MLTFVFNISRDIVLNYRGHISYKNYEKYRLFYNFHPKFIVFFLNIVFFVGTIVLFYFLVISEKGWYHMIPLGVAMLIVGFTLFLYISSQRYNVDLSDFDNYYDIIRTSYVNKELINENLAKIKEKKVIIHQKVTELENECSKIFPAHKSIPNIEKCFEEINTVEQEQTDLLNDFDSKTIKIFNKELRNYLKTKTAVDASLFSAIKTQNVDVDTLISKALVMLKEVFKQYIITTYINNSNKQMKDFQNIINCLHHFKDFDGYYGIIQDSYNSRSLINGNLDKLDDLRNDISDQIIATNNESRKLFPRIDNSYKYLSALEEIKLYISKNEELLNKFDESMLDLSAIILQDYLDNKVANKNNYAFFNYVSNIDLTTLQKNAEESLKASFKETVVDGFKQGFHRNSEELINICECMYNIGAFEPSYGEKLVDYIAVNPNFYQASIEYIYNKNIINYELLKKCNDNGYDWIYIKPINAYLNYNQLSQLMVDILSNDYYKIANKYLVLCDKNDINYIQNALSVANVKNSTSELVEGYISLLQLDGGFNMLSTRYEDIALVLRYYYKNKNNEYNSQIENIISQGEFYENRDLLDQLYNRELLSIQPILTKTFRSLIYYLLYCAKKYDLLQEKKLKELYAEYKKTLNFKGLICMSTLLDALVFINVPDKKALNDVMNNITSNSNMPSYDDYYPLTANMKANYRLYGRDLIQNLMDHHFDLLSTIINFVEKDRLYIDKIRYA